MTAANVVAYAAQVAIVVVICAGLPRLLRLRAPGVQYVFWRVVLAVCLTLPVLQPWRPRDVRAQPASRPSATAAAVVAAAPGSQPASPLPPAPFDWIGALQVVVIAGIGARLGWMALGVARLSALRRRSAGSPAVGFDDLKSAIGIDAPILWSTDVRHPVTFGLVHPVVLLPAALKAVDHAAQRAVVAHELHHVKRRDWGWVIGEEIVRSIFWFHPAMWWLISRVQLARETVVDELSILVTNARRTYLDTLLAFADDTGLGSSPAFSARRHLFHRVMLLSKEGGMSSTRIAAISAALTLAVGGGAWTAVGAFPLHTEQQNAQAQRPPRDPRSPASYHRQAVELWEKAKSDSSTTMEQALEAIERAIALEDRALELHAEYTDAMMFKSVLLRMKAEATADATTRQQLVHEANELRDRAIALRKAQGLPESGWTGAPTPQARQEPPPMTADYKQAIETLQPLRIGGDVKPPAKIRDVKPIYPPIAQANRVQGVVIIEAVIDASGQVATARVLRSIPLLDEAALAAVHQWAFAPTYLNGSPTPVLMTVTVNFVLQ
jgi:TonB family protein